MKCLANPYSWQSNAPTILKVQCTIDWDSNSCCPGRSASGHHIYSV